MNLELVHQQVPIQDLWPLPHHYCLDAALAPGPHEAAIHWPPAATLGVDQGPVVTPPPPFTIGPLMLGGGTPTRGESPPLYGKSSQPVSRILC